MFYYLNDPHQQRNNLAMLHKSYFHCFVGFVTFGKIDIVFDQVGTYCYLGKDLTS